MTFYLDRYGNLTSQTNGQTQGLCANVSFNSATNQISTAGYGYDAAGNMTSDGTGVGSHTYQWDGDGRLKSATVNGGSTVSYVYNALGQQVDSLASGPVYQETYYDAFGRQAVEQNHTTTLEDFFPPVGGINFVKFGAGGTHFLHTDRLGTTAVITAQLNTEWQNLLYYPLGQQWQHADATLDARFAKLQERDAVTGLDPTPARQYNNNLGRWMTPDPGNAGAEASDPQSWNAYSYAGNNPTTNVDPNGEDYYLAGGEKCGTEYECDKQGYILDESGSRYVVTDQEVLSGQAKITEDTKGTHITEGGETFGATFFDLNPQTATVSGAGINQEDLLFAVAVGTQQARTGIIAGAALTAPEFLAAGVAIIGTIGAGTTALELEGPEVVTPTEGQIASVSRAAAQGGRKAVERALRSYQKRLAEHLAKLGEIKGDPGSVRNEIDNFRALIKAAEDWLSKNP